MKEPNIFDLHGGSGMNLVYLEIDFQLNCKHIFCSLFSGYKKSVNNDMGEWSFKIE